MQGLLMQKLRDPLWQAIGAIIGLASLVVGVIALTLQSDSTPGSTRPSETTTPFTAATVAPTTSTSITPTDGVTESPPVTVNGPFLLADLPDLKVNGYDPKSANIDGTSYEDSYSSYLPSCSQDMRDAWEFNLDRKYSRLQAVAGVVDLSESDTRMRFRVLLDNRVVFEKTSALGQSSNINVDVTDVLRLRLEVIATRETCGADERKDIGAFGNPAIQ